MDPGDAASARARERRVRAAEVSGARARVRSLAADAAWIDSAVLPRLPAGARVFANLRAGAWAARGATAAGDASYFKSGDGHPPTWAFAPTRLNLPVAAAAGARGLAAVVDTTRGRKRFSDALTRTLPLWAAVVNATLFGGGRGARGGAGGGAGGGARGNGDGEGDEAASAGDDDNDSGGADDASGGGGGRAVPRVRELAPPWLSDSETSAMQRVADAAVERMAPETRAAISGALAGELLAPLSIVYWCQPASPAHGGPDAVAARGARGARAHESTAEAAWSSVPPLLDGASRAAPVVLAVNASRLVGEGGDRASGAEGWCYLGGAGDDAEGWAGAIGLTPELWARHHERLLDAVNAPAEDDGAAALREAIAAARAADAGAGAGAGAGATGGEASSRAARPRLVSVAPAGAGVGVGVVAFDEGTVAVGDAGALPPLVVIVSSDGGGDAADASADAAGGPLHALDGLLRLSLPVDKPGLRRRPRAWPAALAAVTAAVHALPPPVRDAAVAGGSGSANGGLTVVVARAPGDARVIQAVAVLAAVASCSFVTAAPQVGSGGSGARGGGSKAALRASAGVAAAAAGGHTVDRVYMKELFRHVFGSDGAGGGGGGRGRDDDSD